MAYSLLNHIQGKNGSRWSQFIKETGLDNILIVAIDAAKYTHKALSPRSTRGPQKTGNAG